MPTLNLGQVRPVYRGKWNSTDTYTAYDFVVHNGSAYLALKDVPANYEPPSQTEYWVLFGAKGDPGTPGEDGAPGERGPSPGYRWDGTFLSIQNPDGSWPDQGIDLQGPPVPLSNSVTSTSETDAASSKAVKTAYDRGSAGISAAKTAQSAAKTAQSAAETAQSAADGLRKDVPEIAADAVTPSNKYIDIAMPTWGQSVFYKAPKAGWVSIQWRGPQDSLVAISCMGILVKSVSFFGGEGVVSLYVKKGADYGIFTSGSPATAVISSRFIYASGSAPA